MTAKEVDVAGNTSLVSAAQSLTIRSATPNAVVFVGTPGTDRFTGGAGNDIFEFSSANLANTDTAAGGGGSDELLMTTPGTVLAGGVRGVASYVLANGGANSLTLVNANFGGLASGAIWIYGGNAGNTVNAAAVTGANRIVAIGGAGADTLSGGAGNDTFEFSAATLANTDKVTGGGGTNYLDMTSAGTVAAGGISGVEVLRARRHRRQQPDPGQRQLCRGDRGVDQGHGRQCRQHGQRRGADRRQPHRRGRRRRQPTASPAGRGTTSLSSRRRTLPAATRWLAAAAATNW